MTLSINNSIYRLLAATKNIPTGELGVAMGQGGCWGLQGECKGCILAPTIIRNAPSLTQVPLRDINIFHVKP